MTISRERFSNAIETPLDGAINNSVTSLDVIDGSTFPTAFFRIKIDDELMFCTARSGDTLTVIRGQEATTGASHLDTAPVNHVVTAAGLLGFRKLLLADMALIDPTDSISADDDDFDDESFSGWTTVERGGYASTVVERNHRLSVLLPSGTAAAQFYGYMKAKVPSAGNYIQAGFQYVGGGSSYPMFGLGFSDGATYGAGKQAAFTFSPAQTQWYTRDQTNWDTAAGGSGGTGLYSPIMNTLHLRMIWNSADNYDCLASPDAINWATIFSAAGIGSVGTPSHVGIMLSNWGAPANVFSIPYCRFSW